jgi:hypothetical protein
MLARNETPHHENDFRLCHCQEFIHARRAIQLKIIEGEHGDDDYTALVVPTSYLAWVLRQGFTIPKPLRSLLETASLADPEGDESGPSCTNEPRSGETPLPKQIFKCSNWKDVRITFRNNHDVAITVRETKILNRPFGFAEFDLKNSKSGKPLRAWEVLREIAEGDGFLPVGKEFKKDRDAIRRQISNLNRTLKSLFGRNDNPITFEKVGADGEGWRAKFAVQQSSTVDSSGKLERF